MKQVVRFTRLQHTHTRGAISRPINCGDEQLEYIYIYKGTDDLRSCNDTRQADFRVQAGLAKDNLVLRLRNIALSAALEN